MGTLAPSRRGKVTVTQSPVIPIASRGSRLRCKSRALALIVFCERLWRSLKVA